MGGLCYLLDPCLALGDRFDQGEFAFRKGLADGFLWNLFIEPIIIQLAHCILV